MDFSCPTTGELAWSDAQDALRKNKALEDRITRLEAQVEFLGKELIHAFETIYKIRDNNGLKSQ